MFIKLGSALEDHQTVQNESFEGAIRKKRWANRDGNLNIEITI